VHAANQFLWNANPHTLDGGSGMSEADPGACSPPCVFRIAAISKRLDCCGARCGVGVLLASGAWLLPYWLARYHGLLSAPAE